MAERIDIQISDKVDGTISTKIDGIANSADKAHSAVKKLQDELNRLNLSGVRRLQSALAANQNQLNRNALANQRLATETNRTAAAANLAAAAQHRSIAAQNAAATAAQKLATEQRRTASAALQAQAAQDRAALAALRLRNAQNGAAGAATGHGNALLRLARNAAAIVGVGFSAKAIIDAGDAYTVLQNKLQVVTESERQLAQVTTEVFDVAKRTRAPVLETAQAFSRFDLALKQLGASQRESLELTETVNQAMILGGATTGEQTAGLLQLSQAFNKGKLDGDEFRTVMELMPTVADAIAKQLKVTRGELLELAPKGKITAKVLLEAFKGAREEIAGKFAKTIPTVSQSLTVLRNEGIRTFGEFNKAVGITAALSKGILALANNMNVVLGVLSVLTAGILVAFGPTLLGLLGRATAAVLTFSAALLANPIGLLIVGIAAVSAALFAFRDSVVESGAVTVTLGDYISATFEYIREVISDVTEFFTDIWDESITTVKDIIEDFSPSFAESFGNISSFLKTFINQYIGLWHGSFLSVIEIWKNFGPLFRDIIALAVNQGITNIERFVNAALTGLNNTIDVANSLAKFLGLETIVPAVRANLDQYKVAVNGTAGDVAEYISATFQDTLGRDYLGDLVEDIQGRARQLAKTRVTGDALRGKGPDLSKTPVDKAAEKRADALRKINAELDKELARMSLLKPERDIQARMDEIEIQLLGKKIFLTDKERDAIRKKVTAIELEKNVQAARDKIYEDAIAPQRDYINGLIAISQLVEQGAIKEEQAARATRLLQMTYDDAVNPTKEINRELDQQQDLLRFVGTEQVVQQQIQQRLNELRKKGHELSEVERADLENRIRLIERNTEVNRELNNIYQQTTGAQQNLQDRVTATQQAYERGMLTLDAYKNRLVSLGVEAANLRLKLGSGDFNDTIISGLGKLVEGYEGILPGLASSFGDFFTQLSDGFANTIGRAIVYSESLSEALHKVAQSAIAELISALVKLGIQYLVNATLGQTIAAGMTAVNAALGAATASAWAPAAAMVSLATFGANAGPAIAGLTATVNFAELLSKISAFGFESGGFTGGSNTKDIQGVVHGKEFVVNAEGTARNRAALEAMNQGATFVRTNNASANSRSGGVEVNIENFGTSKEFEVQQMDENSIRIIARDEARTAVNKHAPGVIAQQITDPNSSVSKSISRNTKAERKR